MLPGLTGGIYQFDEAHIDLRPLAHLDGAHLIHAAASSIDSDRRQIGCEHRSAGNALPMQTSSPLARNRQRYVEAGIVARAIRQGSRDWGPRLVTA